jgi:hypothetical protein
MGWRLLNVTTRAAFNQVFLFTLHDQFISLIQNGGGEGDHASGFAAV